MTKKAKKFELMDGEWVEIWKPTEEDYAEFRTMTNSLKDDEGALNERIKEFLVPYIKDWSFPVPISTESMRKEIDNENLQCIVLAFMSMGAARQELLKKFGLL